jgi:hypothetical protein
VQMKPMKEENTTSVEQISPTSISGDLGVRKPQPPRRRAAKKLTVESERQSEKIRVELNIEKWPGIWQPAKGHTKLVARTLERHVSSQAGQAISKLIVGFTDLGTLTTEDQKMFYALIHQWEKAGKPVGKPVYFSDRVLSRVLRKGWGTNVIDAITGSLRRLRTIPLRWIKSFHKSGEIGTEYEEEIPFQMLDDLKIVTRRAHGHVTNQQGYFQFNRHIEANLHGNYTKPLLEDVFFRLESEIAQLIYTHIDLIMFGKTRYERRTKELFDDIGLTGASYRFRSNRKQKLERALKELQGIPLNHGVLRSATIAETSDGEDYKVVFIKGGSRESESSPEQIEILPEVGDVVVNHYARPKDIGNLQAEELVRHFHKVFHSVTEHDPQTRESNQALMLVSQYGLEKAKYVVDFAAVEATRTKYSPQNFGAVLNYVSRASADFDRLKAPASSLKAPDAMPVVRREPEKHWPKGEARLAVLAADQYSRRFEQAKADLFRQNPFLAQRWKEGSPIHEKMIRSRLIQILDAEVMDLVPLNFCPKWYLDTENEKCARKILPYEGRKK